MGEIITSIALIILVLSLISLKKLERYYKRRQWRKAVEELETEQGCKEGFDALTHIHTEHWEYIQSILPWRIRLRLSRLRGRKWALKWRIKLFSLFHGIGPKVAQWIFEEYMITTKVEDLPPPENTWVCPHCGTANQDTALFCKNCGEYK